MKLFYMAMNEKHAVQVHNSKAPLKFTNFDLASIAVFLTPKIEIVFFLEIN